MIKRKEKEIICKLAKKYQAKSIILFGSAVDKKKYNDIDLGVKGVSAERYFDFYGQLISALAKPIDLINLDSPSKFVFLIEKYGVTLL